MTSTTPTKSYRVGRARTGLGLFATTTIKRGSVIAQYIGPLLDSYKKEDEGVANKYLFEINKRWTIDGSVRNNTARYINHACAPNAEYQILPRKRVVLIRAKQDIHPGDEINYNYGDEYFNTYIKPRGCKCPSCSQEVTMSVKAS